MLVFLHLIDLTYYGSTIDFSIDMIVRNVSYYSVKIASTSDIYVNYIGFSRMIFDKTAI